MDDARATQIWFEQLPFAENIDRSYESTWVGKVKVGSPAFSPEGVNNLLKEAYILHPHDAKERVLGTMHAWVQPTEALSADFVRLSSYVAKVKELCEWFEAQMSDSALSVKTWSAARLHPTVTSAFDPHGKKGECFGFNIPYKNGHMRTRLMHPIDGTKYLAPKDSGVHIYEPPVQAGAESSTPIVTEGEKGTLSLIEQGYNAMGLAGVNCWHAPKPKKVKSNKLHPRIESRIQGHSSVTIVCDSDVMEKNAIRDSMLGLAYALENAKKSVSIKVPTPVSGLKKTGIDDFIKAGGLYSLLKGQPPSAFFREISNVYDGTVLTYQQVAQQIHHACPDLYCIGELLYAPGIGFVKKLSQLRTFIHKYADIKFSDSLTTDERTISLKHSSDLYELLAANMPQYDGINEGFEHFPLRHNYAYINVEHRPGEIIEQSNGKLDELAQLFSLKSKLDYLLLKSFILTVADGRLRPGQRPSYAILADNVGAGKTTIVYRLAEILGGYLEPEFSSEKSIQQQILNAKPPKDWISPHIVLLDNLKVAVIASESYDRAVTGQLITGHVYYNGLNSVPNNYVFVNTVNRGVFDPDSLRRNMPIFVLPQPKWTGPGTWEEGVDDFIAQNAADIFADIYYHLNREPVEHSGQATTFALWWRNIICRLVSDANEAEKMMCELLDAKGEIASLANDAERFDTMFKFLDAELHLTDVALANAFHTMGRKNLKPDAARKLFQTMCDDGLLPRWSWEKITTGKLPNGKRKQSRFAKREGKNGDVLTFMLYDNEERRVVKMASVRDAQLPS